MGQLGLHLLFCAVTLCSHCDAEITAEDVFYLLSGRLDTMNSNMIKMQVELDDLDVKDRVAESDNNMAEMKKMFEEFTTEMETKFADLEKKVTNKVDNCIKEAVKAVENQTNDVKSNNNVEESRYLNKHFGRIHASFAAEKVAIRKAIDAFQVRVEDVEQKMITFEKASWKGESGVTGPQGPTGPSGVKGSKGESGYGFRGEKGEQGERGLTGFTGSRGEKGRKGSPETRQSVYFHVSLSSDQSLSQKTIVKFDMEFANVGNGYDATTGKFTAPYSGVYLFLFFVEVGKDKRDIGFIQLYTQGKYRAYTIQESSYDKHDVMGGNAYVASMSAGDTAWLQTGGLANENSNHNLADYGTTFTGILLY